MQILSTPPTDRPKRSFSYNDLKRKRLLRSQKSQRHLNNQDHAETTIKKKSQSHVKSILASIPSDEKVIETCIKELRNVLGSIRQSSAKKRTITVRESMTDRPLIKQSIDMYTDKPKPMWGKIEEQGQTKQLIKHLLNKKKSQRRLIKFTEIRDNLKRQKQRSRSRQSILIQAIQEQPKIKPITSPIKSPTKEYTSHKMHDYHKNIYIRNTQPTLLNSDVAQDIDIEHELEQVMNSEGEACKKKWREQLDGKENLKDNSSMPNFQDVSVIKQNEQAEQFSESDLKILCESEVQGSFLKLLNNQKSFKGILNREVRRKKQLERVRRIFPAGFF